MDNPRILGREGPPKPSCTSLCLQEEPKAHNLSTHSSPKGRRDAEMKYNNE